MRVAAEFQWGGTLGGRCWVGISPWARLPSVVWREGCGSQNVPGLDPGRRKAQPPRDLALQDGPKQALL